jgi:signal transduction histidine kinase
MRIKRRLTYQFTFIFAVILLLSSIAVYFFSSGYRKDEFYSRLNDKAFSTARLLIEVDEIDKNLLKIINKNTTTLINERITIYNYLNEVIFSSGEGGVIKISPKLLDEIRLKGKLRLHRGEDEMLGIAYADQNNRFVVVASAYDKYGLSKLKYLRIILVAVFFSSIGLTLLSGWFYSDQALRPISRVVQQVDKISVSNLNARVDIGNGVDEIAQLAITFNKMLDRLESAFEIQRSFVSNASHELRTPLTAITGQLEVTLMKERKVEEYIHILQSVLDDIRSLNKLSNGLLELAHASMDVSGLKLKQLRVDEVIWQSRAELMKRYAHYRVDVDFDTFPDDEEMFLLIGSEQLVKVAILNLMDNACKFSKDHTVNVLLGLAGDNIKVVFEDKGVGISKEDLSLIFEPFHRGENVRNINGHGLGLSLTHKIVKMHKGSLSISSNVGKGTTVVMLIPKGALDLTAQSFETATVV